MPDINPLTNEELDLLRSFDTPTICNVIELFEVRPATTGYMDRRIRCWFPNLPPMVGYAVTSTLMGSVPPRRPTAYKMIDRQLEAFAEVPAPQVMVFQDLDDPSRAAAFGDVMCSIYRAFGAAGLVSGGPGRDIEQVRALNFPVFAGGVICSHGYPQIVDVNVPVSVGGVVVHPGDLLHADANGVTTIPHEIASEVAHACREFADAEAVILDYLRDNPTPSLKELAAHRDQAMAQMARMRDRLTRRQVSV